MARALRIAAALDVLVGVVAVLAPTAPFSWAGLEAPLYPALMQGMGLFLVAGGVGLGLAAKDPFRLSAMVLAGLVGKVLVTLGFVLAASGGGLPWALGPLVLAVGPAWWVPFGLILRSASQARREDDTPPVLPLDLALSLYRDREGVDLLDASRQKPQFLVFLRHFGCTFCREAISDLSAIRDQLRAAGARLVVVHMSSEQEARDLFHNSGLDDVTAISDPERVLYRAFALRRGSPTQLLGWSVWKRGWEAGVKQGHGIGWLRGDAAQMPGAFVVSQGRVVGQFIHETAADRPDYVDIAAGGVDQAEFQDGLEKDGLGVGFQERLREMLTSEASRN
ncbi:MAG: peroxiredoxin-like family protein [Planctomycetota bacterium]